MRTADHSNQIIRRNRRNKATLKARHMQTYMLPTKKTHACIVDVPRNQKLFIRNYDLHLRFLYAGDKALDNNNSHSR